jgi:preprotein translocase subunit SecG
MELLLTILHIFVCLFLIFVVLLQSGQAADLAGAFGGGGSQTAFGMRGAATLLQKLTTVSAVVFMLTSLGLGIVGRSESSVIDDIESPPPVSAPAEAGQPQGGGGTGRGPQQPGPGDAGSDPGSGRS